MKLSDLKDHIDGLKFTVTQEDVERHTNEYNNVEGYQDKSGYSSRANVDSEYVEEYLAKTFPDDLEKITESPLKFFADIRLQEDNKDSNTLTDFKEIAGDFFNPQHDIERYLRATDRDDVANAANEIKEHLTGDIEVYENPEHYFDQVIEINLSELTPHLNGPFTPDLATPVADMKEKAVKNDWPLDVEWALIGSCTNSSYEDLTRAASIVEDAVSKGLKPKATLGINPGSEQVRFTAERDGLMDSFMKFETTKIFTNACGPCIGQWDREGANKQEKNTIVHSFNRNFAKRADGNPNTHAFVGSPEMVAAIAISGRLDFNPITDTLTNQNGEKVRLSEPHGTELPSQGFAVEDNGYQAPAEDGSSIKVVVAPDSNRLQLLTPFTPWDGANIIGAKLLIKAAGKCNTDHI